MINNLIYFLICIPIIIIGSLILYKLKKMENDYLIIITLSIILFLIRFTLIFFSDSIGVMPYIYPDLLFYILLTFFGVVFTICYVKLIEKTSFKELGWKFENLKKELLFTLLSFLPLICFFPLIMYLANISISLNITYQKIILAIGFGLILGGFYEETMFRGIIQSYLSKFFNPKMTILLTSIIFVLTHICYLPFTGFGIFYIFIFIMALLLSYLRYKFSQIACFILHGGIVFILILFV